MPYQAPIWLLIILLAGGCSFFRTNQETTLPVPLPPPPPVTTSTPTSKEFQALLEADQRTTREINQWLADNREAIQRDEDLRATLANRILARLKELREEYIRYIEAQPRHAEARLRFGSLLSRMQLDDEALDQWTWAVKFDSKLAEAWNNIAGHLATKTRKTKDPSILPRIFNCYDKALRHAPRHHLYPQNLATALGLFPSASATHYGIPKHEVPEKAIALLRHALSLAPDNFEIAADLAESHLDIKPLRKAEAQAAWANARRLAREVHQRQQVDLQLALLEIEDSKPHAARRHLSKVTHPSLLPLKYKLLNALNQASSTSPP